MCVCVCVFPFFSSSLNCSFRSFLSSCLRAVYRPVLALFWIGFSIASLVFDLKDDERELQQSFASAFASLSSARTRRSGRGSDEREEATRAASERAVSLRDLDRGRLDRADAVRMRRDAVERRRREKGSGDRTTDDSEVLTEKEEEWAKRSGSERERAGSEKEDGKELKTMTRQQSASARGLGGHRRASSFELSAFAPRLPLTISDGDDDRFSVSAAVRLEFKDLRHFSAAGQCLLQRATGEIRVRQKSFAKRKSDINNYVLADCFFP